MVSTCKLKTDETGDVRAGAKAVDARAALAVRVRDREGRLRAVVGMAFLGERDFSEQALRSFEHAATALPDATS